MIDKIINEKSKSVPITPKFSSIPDLITAGNTEETISHD